jgi:hypothetical protein
MEGIELPSTAAATACIVIVMWLGLRAAALRVQWAKVANRLFAARR